MKSLPLTRLFALTIVLSFLGPALPRPACAQEQAGSASVEKWEYRVVSIIEARGQRSEEVTARDKSSQNQLNTLGQEGWELVAVREFRTGTPVFYLKRRLR